MMLQRNLRVDSGTVGPSFLARCCALWTGWRDGRAGLPTVALDLDDGGHLPLPEPAFRDRLSHLVRESQDREYSRFLRRTDRLRQDIHSKAQRVVEHADAGSPDDDTVEHQRFTAALVQWTGLVQAEQLRVDAVTHRANALLTAYWSAVQRRHPVFRDPEYAARVGNAVAQRNQHRYPQATVDQFPQPGPQWRPLPLALDQRWNHLLDMLILPDAPASSTGPLHRALQIVTGSEAILSGTRRPAEAS